MQFLFNFCSCSAVAAAAMNAGGNALLNTGLVMAAHMVCTSSASSESCAVLLPHNPSRRHSVMCLVHGRCAECTFMCHAMTCIFGICTFSACHGAWGVADARVRMLHCGMLQQE